MNDIIYKPPTWDEFFMLHVYLVASKSKDPSTKIGAVLVTDSNTLVSEGYNGFCRKVNDDVADRWARPAKYSWIEHGERNSIFNAARNGIKTLNTTMYTQGLPCVDCARSVIQAGVNRIVLHQQWTDIFKELSANGRTWTQDVSAIMFEEAGVKFEYLNKQLGVQSLISGKLVTV
jgi:dCMP deaminase